MSGAKNLQVSPQSNQKSEYKYEYGRSERLIMQMEICDQQNTTVIQILAWRTKLAKSALPEIENGHSQESIRIAIFSHRTS
mmetsp:Transcript_45256/g.61770  ORF Transcript_45256/g.61770 Transcript_45256/m.61770 type:complete len:81 (+) Transcript_45256:68-310(+)